MFVDYPADTTPDDPALGRAVGQVDRRQRGGDRDPDTPRGTADEQLPGPLRNPRGAGCRTSATSRA